MTESSPPTAPDEWLRRYRFSRDSQGDHARSQPYLGVHSIIVYIRDQDESLKFYVERLGFELVVDPPMDSESRWATVVPPDGSVLLALLKPWKGSEQSCKIGSNTGVALETEDITAKFQEWSARGVRFSQAPTPQDWGILASFLDIDGNEFALIQGPWLDNLLNAQRRAVEEQKEAERRAVHEMEIAKQVQARLFPQRRPVPTENAIVLEMIELLREGVYPSAEMLEVLFSFLSSFRVYFRTHADIQMEVLALRHQVTVLQRKTPKPKLTPGDRRLWVFLSRSWSRWQFALITVKPDTVIDWHRRGFRWYWTWKVRHGKARRPGVPQETRELIRTLSRHNALWGAPRIHSELLKLGIKVSQASVAKYMVRHPKPPSQTWRTFLKNHASQLASMDFFTVPTVLVRDSVCIYCPPS